MFVSNDRMKETISTTNLFGKNNQLCATSFQQYSLNEANYQIEFKFHSFLEALCSKKQTMMYGSFTDFYLIPLNTFP